MADNCRIEEKQDRTEDAKESEYWLQKIFVGDFVNNNFFFHAFVDKIVMDSYSRLINGESQEDDVESDNDTASDDDHEADNEDEDSSYTSGKRRKKIRMQKKLLSLMI